MEIFYASLLAVSIFLNWFLIWKCFQFKKDADTVENILKAIVLPAHKMKVEDKIKFDFHEAADLTPQWVIDEMTKRIQ